MFSKFLSLATKPKPNSTKLFQKFNFIPTLSTPLTTTSSTSSSTIQSQSQLSNIFSSKFPFTTSSLKPFHFHTKSSSSSPTSKLHRQYLYPTSLSIGIGLGLTFQNPYWYDNITQIIIPDTHAHEYTRRKRRTAAPRVPPRNMGFDYHIYGGLSPQEFRPFRLCDIAVISDDTCFYYFNLASPESQLNLPVSSYILARAEINGETVIRPYTPIAEFTGELPLLVKSHPHGKMGGKFASMEVGDTLYFKGPFQTFQYEPNAFDRVTLIAGGTGVSPMFQLIEKILTNPLDRTKIHLILANKNELNMPLGRELNELAETYPNRLRVIHILEQPIEAKKWNGLTGHISREILVAAAGRPNPHHKAFVCGPPGLMAHVCGMKGKDYSQGEIGGLLKELGWTTDDVYKF